MKATYDQEKLYRQIKGENFGEKSKGTKSKAITKKANCKGCGVCKSCKAEKRENNRNYNN